MKIIKNYTIPLCKLICSTCGDSEWVEIEQIRNSTPEELLSLSFINNEKNNLLRRIKYSLFALSQFNTYNRGITLDFAQIVDIRDTLKTILPFNKEEEEYIRNYKPKFLKIYKDDNDIKMVFKSKEGISLSVISSDAEDNSFIYWFELNWCLPKDITKKYFLKCCLDYVLNRGKYYISEFNGNFSKSDFIEFFAVLHWFASSVKSNGDINTYDINV